MGLTRITAGLDSLISGLHALLSRLPASAEHVCVYGSPDYEENSLLAAILLAEVEALKVTLLAKEPARAERYLDLLNSNGAPVEVVDKHSVRGLLRASRASTLLFTHGLFGSPDVTEHKLVVNLWHGYGPKATRAATSLRKPIPFQVMTCNTPVWAATAARELGSPDARLLPTGNPRQLAMQMPPTPAAFERLGLAPTSYVVWMPTFRSSTSDVTGRHWRDAPTLSGRSAEGHPVDPVEHVARMASDAGVEVVVKPHPLDADLFEQSGLRVITTDEIFDAGMSLYQFIGSSAAMISDYSSVWVEYLDLDRPLLLYCPDIADYVAGRGLNEPYMTDVAGDLITGEPEVVMSFLGRVRDGEDWNPEARATARRALGLDALHVDRSTFASTVLQEMVTHGRMPGRTPERGPGPARTTAG